MNVIDVYSNAVASGSLQADRSQEIVLSELQRLFSALSIPSETSISLTHFDKFLHFSAFLVLSIFLDLSSIDPLLKKKTLIFLLIAYALYIEVIQYFLPYRDAEFLDFLFDLLGKLVYLMFAPKFKKGQQI